MPDKPLKCAMGHEIGPNEPVVLHGRCHIATPTWCYLYPDNTLVIKCAQCGKEVSTFKLAKPDA